MNRIKLTNSELRNCVHTIIRQLNSDSFKPDYIVGLTRGGLLPATMLSHYLGVPMYALQVSLRDGDDCNCESNLWMAEHAFGYADATQRELLKSRWDSSLRKNILIVDDINDSGATFNWIKQDWQSGCLPDEEYVWNSVWNNNVRFAVLVNNENSDFNEVRYSGMSINKFEDPDIWIDFPWENWWED